MKAMKKILSVLMTAAMVFALAIPAFAVEFKVSAPTPERAWCVTQNQYCDEAGDLLERGYDCIEVPDQPGYYRTLSYYVDKEGNFTEAMMNMLREYIMDSMMDPEDATFDVLDGMELPGNIYDYLRFEIEVLVRVMKYMAEMPELDLYGISEYIGAFLADYPDSETIYAEIMETYFDGNETPAVMDLIKFIYGDRLTFSSYGVDDYTVIYYYDEYITDKDEWYVNVADIVAPNGAYYDTEFVKGKGTNVYKNLEGMISDGWMADPWFSFSLITGYATDNEGYLYTRVPEYVYATDEDGNRARDFDSLIDDNANVIGKDISLREMATQALMETYELVYGDGLDWFGYADVPEVDNGEYERYLTGLLEKYFDISLGDDGEDTVMTEEEMRAMAEDEINSYIADMEEYGEAEFITEMLFGICGYATDSYGYIYEGVEYGYVTDEDGNRLKGSDVMASDGTILIGEYAGRTVGSVLTDFMEGIDSSSLLKGDVNADGKINLTDASTMMKQIAGWEGVEADAVAADANGDGKANLSDVSLTMQYIAGWDVMFGY